ncbi:MAG: hypothetical protein AAF721_26715 [Myxococcota bacterium]
MQSAAKPATTLLLAFSTEFRVELGLGKVRPEKEAWMFGEYLPATMAELADYERGRLGTFAVLAANAQGVTPAMGALNTWPSVEVFKQLLADERFTRRKPERDAAMEVLDDRHILAATSHTVEVDTQTDYALVLASESVLPCPALFAEKIAEDSINQERVGQTLSLHPWTDEAEALMAGAPSKAVVYRIRFAAPQS